MAGSLRGRSFVRLLLIAAAIAIVTTIAVALALRDSACYPPLAVGDVPADGALIERGRYLALVGNCTACHTAEGHGFMAGGVAFETPFGRIYSTNITPDPEYGIGSWDAEAFARSMRFGVRPGGEHLYPVFPYTSFTKISDDDLLALFAYFKSIPAVATPNLDNGLSFPFRYRGLLSAWKALFFEPGPWVPDDGNTENWNRGAYLVEALAHCGECHSPRNALGAVESERRYSGGRYLDKVPGGEWRAWFAPNLTAVASGLLPWPQDELTAYLKTGRNSFVDTYGPMNEVILHSTQHLEERDVAAMSGYLKSLPAIEAEHAAAADGVTLGRGRTIYNLHCGTCHLPTGLGDPEMAPRLSGGSLVVRARDPASLINVILYGPEEAPLPMKWREPMEEFQYLLDDDEVAALASFVRDSWDNGAGAVTADQVARQR